MSSTRGVPKSAKKGPEWKKGSIGRKTQTKRGEPQFGSLKKK